MAKHTAEEGSGTDPTCTIRVLSVSPFADDHSVLRNLFRSLLPAQQSGTKWLLNTAFTLESAIQILHIGELHKNPVAIVICDSSLTPGTWKTLLGHIATRTQPPFMIVTSPHADDYLWIEALNLGVYDVLRKPFDLIELRRVLAMAAIKWTHRRGV